MFNIRNFSLIQGTDYSLIMYICIKIVAVLYMYVYKSIIYLNICVVHLYKKLARFNILYIDIILINITLLFQFICN